MRRVLLIGLVLAGAGVLAVVGTGAGGGGGDYKVRAIFDNAVSVIPGETVKVAGVVVGQIDSLDTVKPDKAAVVLNITTPGFQDFRTDAHCIIRPEGFIGEKFVECTPTAPRQAGQPPAPKLTKIDSGPGKGQYLLPVQNTTTPVDLDLINTIFRLPYGQRLTLILNELGGGLAGRGDDLNTVIKRSNPALLEVDKVLAILAKQNQTLADLATNSDKVLRPLARNRARVADFIVKANTTAQATASRRTALEASFQKLPAFLSGLQPTLAQLSDFADVATPTLRDLGAAAPDLNRIEVELKPFADASLPATKALGVASAEGSRALPAAQPLIGQLQTFADLARPLSANLSQLLVSLRDTGGIERLMDFLFYTTNAVNGYDSVGRFLRASLAIPDIGDAGCGLFAATPVPPTPPGPIAPVGADCSANFNSTPTSTTTTTARQAAQIAAGATGGATPKSPTGSGSQGGAAKPGKISLPDLSLLGSPGSGASQAPAAGATPRTTGRATVRPRARGGSAGANDAAATESPAQAGGAQQSAQDSLFNYLLGAGG